MTDEEIASAAARATLERFPYNSARKGSRAERAEYDLICFRVFIAEHEARQAEALRLAAAEMTT